jgi:hypothetical protein
MQDFPANSQKAKTRSEAPPMPGERPEIKRVTSAEAVRRKRGLGRQFKETFIGGSSRMALEYMVTDIVVPAVRDTIFEALQGGLDRLIYGESRIRRGGPPSSYSSYSNVGHVNYQSMSTPTRTSKPPGSRMLSRQSRARQSFDEIVIPNRAEAEEVLDRMYDELSRYGSVPVSVLYELTGIQSSHTDHKWGWTQLRGARVATLPRSGGYLLDLPEPEPLSS